MIVGILLSVSCVVVLVLVLRLLVMVLDCGLGLLIWVCCVLQTGSFL